MLIKNTANFYAFTENLKMQKCNEYTTQIYKYIYIYTYIYNVKIRILLCAISYFCEHN